MQTDIKYTLIVPYYAMHALTISPSVLESAFPFVSHPLVDSCFSTSLANVSGCTSISMHCGVFPNVHTNSVTVT